MEAPLPPEPTESVVAEDSKSIAGKSIASSHRPQSGLWWGWWSRPDGYDIELPKPGSNDEQLDEATSTPLPGTPNNEMEIPDPVSKSEPADTSETAPEPAPGLQPGMSAKTGSARSWFGLWSNAQNEQAAIDEQAERPPRK